MKLMFAVVSREAILDKQTSTASLIHIVEQLQFGLVGADGEAKLEVDAGPVIGIPYPLFYVALFSAETEAERNSPIKIAVEIQREGDKGKSHMEVEGEFNGKPRWRAMIRLDVFPYTGPGAYVVRTIYRSQGSTVTHEYPISVEGPAIPAVAADPPKAATSK